MEIDPPSPSSPSDQGESPSASGGGGVTAEEEEIARKAIDTLVHRSEHDTAARVAATQKLPKVAAALGHDRTREELIPFMTENADDEDEVLLAMATSIAQMVEYVGGPQFARLLLGPLELLLSVEETGVRDRAVQTTLDVVEVIPTQQRQSQYYDMLLRLALKEWFTARMSASVLVAHGYAQFLKEEQQPTLLEKYKKLCQDDTPMVRRIAGQNLGRLLYNLVTSHSSPEEALALVGSTLLPLYEEVAGNNQPDSVRLQTTQNCVDFGKAMCFVQEGKPAADASGDVPMTKSEEITALVKRVLPLIVSTIDDRSWRVRWTAASKFADVVVSFAPLPNALDSLIPAYEKLLQDPEAEVRTAATLNLIKVADCKGEVLETSSAEDDMVAPDDEAGPKVPVAIRLVKLVTGLTEDDSENVRAALAMVATQLAPILGKDATISHLVPPVLLLLRDSTSEVRLNVISSLTALNDVIGIDLLSQSLLPAILDLAEDGKWRIRLATIQHIPLLAQQLGKEFFSEKLSSLCVGWLGDDISSIRQAAATNLKELTALFGAEWATVYLIPAISEIRRHRSYLRRLTSVKACALMSTAMDPETARTELLPMVLEMASDSVPNIRFNVAKALEMMAPICGSEVCELQIRPVLTMLSDDHDRDVRYYAARTATTVEKEFGEEPAASNMVTAAAAAAAAAVSA